MHISELIIQRYRAFEGEVRIPLSRFNVLTGPNNTGKSTVLEALQLCFVGLYRPPFNYAGRPQGLPHYTRVYTHKLDYPRRLLNKRGHKNTTVGLTITLTTADLSALRSKGLRLPATVTLFFEYSDDDYSDLHERTYAHPAMEFKDLQILGNYIAENMRYVHISAKRTFEQVKKLLAQEIVDVAIRRAPSMRRRQVQMSRFIADAIGQLTRFEKELARELRKFMPALRSVSFELMEPRIADLIQLADIRLNDGTDTVLERKGDGARSLFIIGVLHYLSAKDLREGLILSIEEPEAHLHSDAIYHIKPVLRALTSRLQLIITTHSPILVQRDHIPGNLIVDLNKSKSSLVRPAKTLAEIRESLGIKPYENMMSAEVVIVVEGMTEERVLTHFLAQECFDTHDAFAAGRVRVLSADSASKVASVVRALAREAANCVVLLDNDAAGRQCQQALASSGLLQPTDILLVPPREHCLETEFEDLFEPEIYINAIASYCGCALTAEEFRLIQRNTGKKGSRSDKWSIVVQRLLTKHGKDWPGLKVGIRDRFTQAVVEHAGNHGDLLSTLLADIVCHVRTMLDQERPVSPSRAK